MSLTGPTRPTWVFLSDLHVGDGSGADDFGPSPQPSPGGRGQGEGGRADCDLIAFCARARARRDRVVVVGDLFDLWQTGLADIEKAHGEAIEALMEVLYYYVAGNHDWDMLERRFFGVRAVPLLIEDGILVMHAHQVDPEVAKWPKTARAVSGVVGFFERFVHHDFDRWAEGVEGWFSRTGRHGQNRRYIAPLSRLAIEHGCHSVVFGHTHRFAIGLMGPMGLMVSNCGTWTDGHRDCLSLGGAV